uniref:Uncharacterized protein n=1 Tax=Anguilla anguilla TaxID=7936 RepID=A0A0E9WH02_ANGAN
MENYGKCWVGPHQRDFPGKIVLYMVDIVHSTAAGWFIQLRHLLRAWMNPIVLDLIQNVPVLTVAGSSIGQHVFGNCIAKCVGGFSQLGWLIGHPWTTCQSAI